MHRPRSANLALIMPCTLPQGDKGAGGGGTPNNAQNSLRFPHPEDEVQDAVGSGELWCVTAVLGGLLLGGMVSNRVWGLALWGGGGSEQHAKQGGVGKEAKGRKGSSGGGVDGGDGMAGNGTRGSGGGGDQGGAQLAGAGGKDGAGAEGEAAELREPLLQGR